MADRLQSLCVAFRRDALASSCGVVDAHGGLVASDGAPADALAHDAARVRRLWDVSRDLPAAPVELVCACEGRSLVVRAIDDAHLAFVWFDHRSSLALVRLRLRALAAN